MTNTNKIWILAGVFCCWVAAIGQFVTDYWFTLHYPGYHWVSQSLSYLGQAGSPIEGAVATWGVLFSLLFVPVAIGFYKAFAARGKWVKLGAFMLLIYGLGEGAGSGLVPVEASPTGVTWETFLHVTLSIAGDAGLFLLPLVMVKIFPKQAYPRFFTYSWLVLITGFSFSILFALTKSYPAETGLMHYRGVWQRAYTLVFHVYLISISFKMLQELPKDVAMTDSEP